MQIISKSLPSEIINSWMRGSMLVVKAVSIVIKWLDKLCCEYAASRYAYWVIAGPNSFQMHDNSLSRFS